MNSIPQTITHSLFIDRATDYQDTNAEILNKQLATYLHSALIDDYVTDVIALAYECGRKNGVLQALDVTMNCIQKWKE